MSLRFTLSAIIGMDAALFAFKYFNDIWRHDLLEGSMFCALMGLSIVGFWKLSK